MNSPVDRITVSRRRVLALGGALGLLPLLAGACQSAPATPAPAAPKPTTAPAPSPAAAKPTAAASKPAATTAPAPAAKPTTAAPAKPVQLMKWRAEVPSPKLDINAFHNWPVRRGWYKELGLDVEIQHIVDPTAVKALVAGELESYDSGYGPVLQAIENGAEMKAVASFHPVVPFVLVAKKGINSVDDLVGKTVGISEKGSVTESYVQALLFKRNIDSEKINWVPVGQGGTVALLQALIAGKIEAATAVVGQVPAVERQADLHVISRIYEELPDLMRLTVCVSDKMLRDNPDRVTAFVAGYAKGIRYGLDKREETIDLMVELTGASREDMAYSWDWFSRTKALDVNGAIRPAQVDYYQDLYVRLGLLKQKLPLEKVADLTIQPKAMALIGPYEPGKTA